MKRHTVGYATAIIVPIFAGLDGCMMAAFNAGMEGGAKFVPWDLGLGIMNLILGITVLVWRVCAYVADKRKSA